MNPGIVEGQAGFARGAPARQEIQRADEQDRCGDRGGAPHALASRIRVRAPTGGSVPKDATVFFSWPGDASAVPAPWLMGPTDPPPPCW